MPENDRSIQQDALGFPSKLRIEVRYLGRWNSSCSEHSGSVFRKRKTMFASRRDWLWSFTTWRSGNREADREWAADHGQSGL